MDAVKMAEGIRRFLEGVGERFPGDDLDATPDRVARAFAEDLLSGYGSDPVDELTWTDAPEGAGLVCLRDVRMASVCVHHLLPFTGMAHVAYLPAARIAGLSKLGRVVDGFSRRLQIQERLTAQIADAVARALEPRAVLVVLEAVHTCMTLRGVRKEGSLLVTTAARGAFADDVVLRREAMAVLAPGRAITD